MNTSRGRYLAELRRSNAAGIHSSVRCRSSIEENAIKEEIMSYLDEDYSNVTFADFGMGREPTEDELDDIEAEEYEPDDPTSYNDPALIYDEEDLYPYDSEYDRY